jgi:hypothetical protein
VYIKCRVHRNILARSWWLRERRAGSQVSEVGIGLLGESLAFGLTVLTGACAFVPISGGRFPAKHLAGEIEVELMPQATLVEPYRVFHIKFEERAS